MSVQRLDLGSVFGLSAYELWLTIEGNEGKTIEEFWEWLRSGLVNITDAVEEGNPDVVTSNGVWVFVTNLINQLKGEQESGQGETVNSNILDICVYSLRDPLEVTQDDEVVYDYTDRLSSEEVEAPVSGESDGEYAWTLTPLPGQSWIIDNACHEDDTLEIELPDGAPIGSRIDVSFVATKDGDADTTCSDVAISGTGVLVTLDEAPESIKGIIMSCTMGKYGWQVERHYIDSEQHVVKKPSITVIYSGNNYKATADRNYTTTYTGTAGQSTVSFTPRTDIFQNLYGSPRIGWTTQINGRTAQTISAQADGTVLTLYPVYQTTSGGSSLAIVTRSDATAIAKWSSNTNRYPYADTNRGPERGPVYPGTNGYLQRWKPSSYISGFKESTVKAQVTIWANVNNNDSLKITMPGNHVWTIPSGSKGYVGYHRVDVTFNVWNDGQTGATDCALRLEQNNNTDFWWGVTKIYMP